MAAVAGNDNYWGHEEVAKICASFIRRHFQPGNPSALGAAVPSLEKTIAHCLHRTHLEPTVVYTALYLLALLSERFSGQLRAKACTTHHRLFLTAFLLSTKILCDRPFSNSSFSKLAVGICTLPELNQAERELCRYLDWRINPAPAALAAFERAIKCEYSQDLPPFGSHSLACAQYPGTMPGAYPIPTSSLVEPDAHRRSFIDADVPTWLAGSELPSTNLPQVSSVPSTDAQSTPPPPYASIPPWTRVPVGGQEGTRRPTYPVPVVATRGAVPQHASLMPLLGLGYGHGNMVVPPPTYGVRVGYTDTARPAQSFVGHTPSERVPARAQSPLRSRWSP